MKYPVYNILYFIIISLIVGILPINTVRAEEIVIYSFEDDLQDWEIPGWARSDNNYVGSGLVTSSDVASEKKSSMRIMADFPDGKDRWSGVYVECMMDVRDWTDFYGIEADIYVPEDAPEGLGGKFIFTIGTKEEDWKWTEMNRAIPLKPGQWNTISANVRKDSLDWKFFLTDDFRKDIKKVGIRIEPISTPPYAGPIYIDNIRVVSEKEDLK